MREKERKSEKERKGARRVIFPPPPFQFALLTGCALVFGALAAMRFRWDADG
jgi:hypothetical protein